MQVAGKIVAGIVVVLAAAAGIVLLNADALLSGVVKERILRSANSTPGTSLSLGRFHYSFFANRISVDSLRLSVRGDKAAPIGVH